MNRFSMLKGAAAVMTLAAVTLPGLASAQTYDYRRDNSGYGYGQSYDRDYRQCDSRDRQATGAVVGATLGAVAGSQMSARGRRTENSVLGGLIGAVIGAGVGGDSANCRGQADRYDQRGYDYRGYDQRAYDQRGGYAYQGYERDGRYDDRRYEDRRYDDRAYADACSSERHGRRTVETPPPHRDGPQVPPHETGLTQRP